MSKIWYPLQRAFRTAAQVIVGAAAVLVVVVAVAPQVIDAVADVVPGPVIAWATGAVATLAAISAALSRVMAIPQIDAWLKHIGLGSEPIHPVITFVDGELTGMTRREFRAKLNGDSA